MTANVDLLLEVIDETKQKNDAVSNTIRPFLSRQQGISPFVMKETDRRCGNINGLLQIVQKRVMSTTFAIRVKQAERVSYGQATPTW